MGGSGVRFSVVGLSGDATEVHVGEAATVSCIKAAIHGRDPTKATCWQRLLHGGRELCDEDCVESIAGGSPAPVTLTLVVVVDPSRLVLGSPEAVAEAAGALEAMGAGMDPHLSRLFADEAGEPLQAPAAEEVLDALGQRLGWASAHEGLRTALVPHAMGALASDEAACGRSGRLCRIFGWLGAAAAPHLVAWLGLLERPVPPRLARRVEQLGRFHASARVRLAAKRALRDGGGPSVARVEELAELRASLGRDLKAGCRGAAGLRKRSLEALRASACAALRELGERAGDARVRYAASRALRRQGGEE